MGVGDGEEEGEKDNEERRNLGTGREGNGGGIGAGLGEFTREARGWLVGWGLWMGVGGVIGLTAIGGGEREFCLGVDCLYARGEGWWGWGRGRGVLGDLGLVLGECCCVQGDWEDRGLRG